MCPGVPQFSLSVCAHENIVVLPLWLKRPSISMEDLEWAMQSMAQGTMPSWAGQRSVVLTRHQSGLSWSRSRTSTVWPRRTVSSPPLPPWLAMKSWITTVNSQPPESWNGRFVLVLHVCTKPKWTFHITFYEHEVHPICLKTKYCECKCSERECSDALWLDCC